MTRIKTRHTPLSLAYTYTLSLLNAHDLILSEKLDPVNIA